MLTIVGNGPSRLKYNLNELENWWGCNQIFTDAIPDMLFCMDIPQQVDIFGRNYHHEHKVAVGGWEPMEIEYYETVKIGLSFGQGTLRDFVDTNLHDWFVVMGNEYNTELLGYSSSHKDNIVIYNIPKLKNLFTGMSALGYAMEQGVKEITLLGFDALQYGDVSNVYEGRDYYQTKYTLEDRVFDAQRSQFIALLKEYNESKVYFKNSLDKLELVEYNELDYYESSNQWCLGEGFLSDVLDTM